MAVAFGSIVSGLPPGLVEKLIEVEREPIKRLEERKGNISAQLQLLQDLRGKVNKMNEGLIGMSDAKSFTDLKPISSNPDILDATVDKGIAEPGMYRFEIMELADRSSARSNGFPDKDSTQVGVGYFTMTRSDGESVSVYVDSKNNTLEGIAKTINDSGTGLKARVVNDGTGSENPWRLAINGTESGKDGKIEFPTFYFIDGDQEFYVEGHENARTAKIRFDGFEMEMDENTIKDLIPGVVIDLKRAAPGQTVTLKINKDVEKMSAKVDDFVKNLNDVLKFIIDQNTMDDKTNTRRTLGGDSTLHMLERRLRSILQAPVPSSNPDETVVRASDIGIQFQRNGQLSLEKKKFENAVQNSFESVANIFIGDRMTTGIVTELTTQIKTANDLGSGYLANREKGLKERISRIDNDIERKERNVEKKAEAIRKKFAALESAMGNLKQQTSAISALGGGGGGVGVNLSGAGITGSPQ